MTLSVHALVALRALEDVLVSMAIALGARRVPSQIWRILNANHAQQGNSANWEKRARSVQMDSIPTLLNRAAFTAQKAVLGWVAAAQFAQVARRQMRAHFTDSM